MAGPVVNIAGYTFAPPPGLPGLPSLRSELRSLCSDLGLLGTILLAPEGINLFLAGSRPSVDRILEHIKAIPGLEGLTAKESFSSTLPFAKLRVRLKREIISFAQPAIQPASYTSRRISPQELDQWLTEGRPVTLLDTRNTYETELGTFQAAQTLPLNDFMSFREFAASLVETLDNRPVVTFCTGGIRCEKAAPYLESLGVREVYQLDGGILNYFEKVGARHYTGACFVFDKRTAVTPDLAPVLPNPRARPQALPECD